MCGYWEGRSLDSTQGLDDAKKEARPWLVWLNGLSAGLRAKGSPVRFPVRVHAWVVAEFPVWGVREATTHWCFSPSPLSPFLSKKKKEAWMRNNLEGMVAGYNTNATYSGIFAQEKILNRKSGRNFLSFIPFLFQFHFLHLAPPCLLF